MVTFLPGKSTCAGAIHKEMELDASERVFGRLHSIKVDEKVEPKMTHPRVERAP